MKRKTKDRALNAMTYAFSSVGILTLLAILVFVFQKGSASLSWNLLWGNYYETTYNASLIEPPTLGGFADPNIENTYFSASWGLSLEDAKNTEGDDVVQIAYIDQTSPLRNMNDVSGMGYVRLENKQNISKVLMKDAGGQLLVGLGKNGAEAMATVFDQGVLVTDLLVSSGGGGIRGSLITTGVLIVLTLLIALPIGVGAAIYLHEYAPDNRWTQTLRELIKITTGIPSVIFGLVGAILFIPAMNALIGSSGGSIASGALTLALILLPVIIQTTEEALKVIPSSYRQASLALGASKTQTVFNVVLPNAIPGVLTATLLSIGRIIGESAALVYAVGAVIKDQVSINDRSTSLAVHIWSVMGGENPNIALAAGIAIIILTVVFILSVIVKILGKKMNKMGEN